MNFDEIYTAPCVLPADPNAVGACKPPTDDIVIPGGCSDPEYAAAHPDECDSGENPRLVLKPEVATMCVGDSLRFRAVLTQGETEVDLEDGLLFTVNDQNIAIIGAISGSMTAVAAGIVNVTVTWQDQTANAQVQIGAGSNCCDDSDTKVVIAIDNSESMSQVFGGAYATKLIFAKANARAFVESMNLERDSVSLYSFNSGASLVLEESQDEAALVAGITAIPSTQASTDIAAGLQAAVDQLDGVTGRRVIVLLTDGINHDNEDPVAVADAFRAAGGIIIVVGIRSSGNAFAQLNRIASGGFFLSGYPAVADDTIDYLVGLKSYFCSGDCLPEGNTMESRPQLNFTGFTKWDVIAGEVDLIGAGSDGFAQYDFLPGNGLYLDIAGSGPAFRGTIRTKDAIQFTGGRDYQVFIKVAGNQRLNFNSAIRVTIGTLWNDVIQPTSWTEDFVEYTLDFFAGVDELAKIVIAYEEVDTPEDESFGPLVDAIRVVENLTTTLFEDDFDDENQQYVTPRCGEGYSVGTGYVYGYGCYAEGCLTIPPEAQVADPNALSDVEAATGSGGAIFHYPRIPQ